MILQQYRELLKLRNTEIIKGKETLNDTVKRSGGMPVGKELQLIIEKAMFHFIDESSKKEEEIKKLENKVSQLLHKPVDMDLIDYIKFQSIQIAKYESNQCKGEYVGTEHKTSFIYDNKKYNMVLNIF